MLADPQLRTRRATLQAAAALLLLGGSARAETALVDGEDDSTLLVAGPQDGATAGWARLLLPAIAGGLAEGATLRLRFAGGRDGVTGANQFDARAMPDGRQAILFPGSAALAWMAGDSRVRFDPAHFVPMAAIASTDVVMLRGGLHQPARPTPLRLPCGNAPDPAQTALMAFDLLAIAAVVVPPVPDQAASIRAGAADAVFLRGSDVPAQIEALREAGLKPAFTTGLAPHPNLPASHPLRGVPHLLSLVPPAQRDRDPMVAAWRGVAAASSLDLVLALPRLSGAAALSNWRRACRTGFTDSAVAAQIDRHAMRLLSDDQTASALQMVRGDATAQAALRRWLAGRVNWRPG